jgi:5-methyltetrahydropteroyltriglutamate--homocysteine methyltransferase
MLTHNLGYPRIGDHRELKKACEHYWAGGNGPATLLDAAKAIRQDNWLTQQNAGLDLIPCNDFSLYDHVLDTAWALGAAPPRYGALRGRASDLDVYFAMARGYQKNGCDLTALEMTKWFDTNYHYLVPEFRRDSLFQPNPSKLADEFREAKELGVNAKPVLIGPVSFLLLGKEKEPGFQRLELLDRLLPVYLDVLHTLDALGASHVQLDEPYLVTDLAEETKAAYGHAYARIAEACPRLKIILTTYFGDLGENLPLALHLPIHALHLDLARAPEQLPTVLATAPESLHLSLGLVNGRNVWKNDYERSLALIDQAVAKVGRERLMLAPSCSLLHCPCDLDHETELAPEIRRWLAFARQKLEEAVTLAGLAEPETRALYEDKLAANRRDMESRRNSPLIHRPKVKARLEAIQPGDLRRQSPFPIRREKQQARLRLPLLPTTTIGSFPQTEDVRRLRIGLKKGELTREQYEAAIEAEIQQVIHWQENIDLDVLVHGEFERNDMVEYFGQLLDGFAFTRDGWVQSYGSRCVKPPILYGDVSRAGPMTVRWSRYAQSLTRRPVKGMLTGPVTLLQWSFVRDDQPRSIIARQIALALRDEVRDLEQSGIRIIQIDEPAIREGLPLRKKDWADYLAWAVEAFRIASSGVADDTQIHTHMCYSEFNDIIEAIAAMDADVITIENSRSQMELIGAFTLFRYPNEIGPGVYDIHSPRVPSEQEIEALLRTAMTVLPAPQLWVNPDCGLKTRHWPETKAALVNMVAAAKSLRERLQAEARQNTTFSV